MKAIVLGSSGAVGTALTKELIAQPSIAAITLLLRRPHPDPLVAQASKVTQHLVDVFSPPSYEKFLVGHELAFSTFGVGQPSKITREEFVATDLDAVQNFAAACRRVGVRHFSSLAAVGANAQSKIFYVQIKGRLEQALIDLGFDRLTLVRPSMIITPQNRYGFSQALTLVLYPYLDPLLIGGLKRFRSIKVEELGQAMARNALRAPQAKIERLTWADLVQFVKIA